MSLGPICPLGYHTIDSIEILLSKFYNVPILYTLLDRIYDSKCLSVKLEIMILDRSSITEARNFIYSEEQSLKIFRCER